MYATLIYNITHASQSKELFVKVVSLLPIGSKIIRTRAGWQQQQQQQLKTFS